MTWLVAGSAALIAATGLAIAGDQAAEALRVHAGVITGIGFIGGGAVLHKGGDVEGLTTAATVLSAAVMSIYAIGLLTGRIATGFALDHLPAPLVGAFMTVVPAIGIVLLMLPAPSFALAALAVGLIGLQQGSEVDLFAFFISRNFGVKHYSSIYGLIAMAGALSTAIALVMFGKVHDATGSYQAALIIGGVLFVLGRGDGAAIGEVAEALDTAPSAMSGLIDRMERAGLVERRADPADGRGQRIHMTAAGREAREAAKAGLAQVNAKITEGFSEAEIDTVARWLASLQQRFPERKAK